MIRTLIWFSYFWGFLFWHFPAIRKARVEAENLPLAERDELIASLPRRWARTLVKLTGSTVEVFGEEHIPKDRPVLFVSNHQGNFDVPILIGFIHKPKGFISKIEVKKMPIIGSYMEAMKCVFIDRKNKRQSVKAIQEGIKYLKDGHSLVIFPEGTRSKGKEIGEFKGGSFRLAVKSEVPIIPVTINGSYQIMEKNGFIMKPANVKVYVSDPIFIDDVKHLSMDELGQYVKTIIAKNLKNPGNSLK
ncbi:lysophospholipid acyltransferase family protein [Calidifontibacillus oryziterrae]|uniref:lysophospholipid acyltransferase family protein n=1 Tax=Calidifontibacillus oryziterrae TaxID=1191699 RepID=UPI0002FBB2BB|nr:lysophospholipid acyltransferase family protein [Calidifontibacillus oryziterrae]